ncbi:GNAT family N-acetyltransferase [Rhodococcus maanshanensis]|uniref:DNA gyrase/topoisomerase IV, subunit A n=1 Tax=Rhodococcus maanshanensis TaxID=183556 RepID=A0A1H7WC78_9NOCA|nr:GNAT family N-acetyltransferase [Rhodococcus maanshanensis]SEM18618.1 DNA gyrase/topoisomerase IV, subunit A [Rhodococcus maanshanensis]
MTAGPQDQILDRRELASALLRALDLRHEVLDAIVDSDDHAAAVRSVSALLETTEDNANAVLGLQLGRLTKLERDHLRDEVTNLDATLKWLPEQRPFSTGTNVRLRPFTQDDEDVELYRRRSAEQLDADGKPWQADRIEEERRAGLNRVDEETAAWFVAENTSGERPECVGLVFGELHGGEVELAVWVAPESRKQGYGTAVIKLSRPELAAYFPGTTVIVRSPA